MSDTSKAKWPDGMFARKDTSRVDMGGFETWFITTNLNHVLPPINDRQPISEYRAKQICALPKIVELLKEMSGDIGRCDSDGEWEAVPERFVYKCDAILREIGESE